VRPHDGGRLSSTPKAALEANKSVAGKAALAAYIAAHADLHGQQRPLEPPVTDFEPMRSLIIDLLHGLDLNIPKVGVFFFHTSHRAE
jgi:hypothetical protein